MPLDEPANPGRPDPASNLFDSALRDSAVVLDAYARFATTLIGILLFPYASMAPAKSPSREDVVEGAAGLPHCGIIQVVLALLIGLSSVAGSLQGERRAARAECHRQSAASISLTIHLCKRRQTPDLISSPS
jgi:hypothetical protein